MYIIFNYKKWKIKMKYGTIKKVINEVAGKLIRNKEGPQRNNWFYVK
jgi:hypothetical protein